MRIKGEGLRHMLPLKEEKERLSQGERPYQSAFGGEERGGKEKDLFFTARENEEHGKRATSSFLRHAERRKRRKRNQRLPL